MSLDRTYSTEEKVNTITSILGYSENGDPKASAIPLFFDDWFHGDFHPEKFESYSEAKDLKFPDEYGQGYPNWRMDTAIEIGFDSPDGTTIASGDWDASSGSSEQAEITLDDDTFNPFRDIAALDFDGPDDALEATIKGPYEISEKITVNGVDGVRASVIYGGSDDYLSTAKEKGETLASMLAPYSPGLAISAAMSRYFAHVTTFYVFVEFVVMADGAKLARIWDASRYPSHDLYYDGNREIGNKFREGIEWVQEGSPLEHSRFVSFGVEGNTPALTPFDQGGSLGYRQGWNKGAGLHPFTPFGLPGSIISALDIENKYPDPLFPTEIDNPTFF